jgi:hypothetical protein
VATEEIIAKYKLDIEDLQAKVRVIEAELLKTETAAKKAGEAGTAAVKKTAGEANLAEQAFNKLGAAIVAAFSVNAIINFGKASIKSFQEAELSAKKLQVAVGVSGGLQKDFDNLIKQSKELQKIGIFSDEAIQGVQTAALQFGLTAREVEKLVPIVADFASATGQDLTSAMDAVLRGIEGQERGLKKHSVTLIEGATRVENLDRISQQLSKTFDGQAKIVGETSAGAFAKLNNQMDEMQERIGERLAPRLGKLKFILTGIAEE